MHIVTKMTEETKKKGIESVIDVPEKTEARVEGTFLIVKGPKGEIKKNIADPIINLKVEEGRVVVNTNKSTKREKKCNITLSIILDLLLIIM